MNKMKSLPLRRKQKWRTAEKSAESSWSKAEQQVSVSDSFLEKKVRGDQDCCTCCWSTPPMCVSEASTARDIYAPGAGCKRMGMEERMSGAWLKIKMSMT